jgi:DNA-binding response OmpR family regulator
MRILVRDVSGGPVGQALATVLSSAGHEVALATQLEEADLVILAGNRDAVVAHCRQLRDRDPALPILVLTSAGLVDDRVAALRAGADDCVEVPYHASQMVARVDALERRARLVPALPDLPDVIDADGCVLDLSRCVAARDDRALTLSAREAALLRYLHHHRARAVTREEILEHVFGVAPTIETRSVDVAIGALRKKIERRPEDPRIVIAIKGIGYAWGASRPD